MKLIITLILATFTLGNIFETVNPGHVAKLLFPQFRLPNPQSEMVSAHVTSPTFGNRFLIFGGEGMNGISNDLFQIHYGVFEQYASEAKASSEYCSLEAWSGNCAIDATGPPDNDFCGDYKNMWTPHIGGLDKEWLYLTFKKPIHATAVIIRETRDPGFVTKVVLIDVNGGEHVVHDGLDLTTKCPDSFVVTFPLTSYKVIAVNITTQSLGWEAIDSVKLVGLEDGLRSAEKVYIPMGGMKPEGISKSQVNDDFYVFGGHTSLAEYKQDLWKFSIAKNQWSIVEIANPDEAPVGRRHGSMIGVGNDFYLFGGYNTEQGLLDDFYKFDTISNTWSKIVVNGNTPPARSKATMAYDGEETIVLFGGVTDKEISNELWLYNVVNNTWTLINGNHKPPARENTISGFWGNYFVIFGGYNNVLGPLNDIWMFDMNQKIWIERTPNVDTPLPEARFRHAGTVVDNKLVVFGGVSRRHRFLGDFWEFHFDTNQWKELKFPQPRSGHIMHSTGDSILIHGGQNDVSILSDTWKFNLQTQEWTEVQTFGVSAPAIAYHTAVEFSNNLFIFGGLSSNGPTQETYIFNLETNTWKLQSVGGETPARRYGHDAAIFNSTMYITGGYGNGVLTDIWAFDIATGKWENLPVTTSSTPAYFRTSTRYKSQILFFGGQNVEFSHPTRIYSYDIEKKNFSSVWSQESVLGVNYFFAGSHSVMNNNDLAIISFGTYPGDPTNSFSTRMILYDIKERELYNYGGLSPGRAFHKAIVYKRSFFIFGGNSTMGPLNDLWEFEAQTLCPPNSGRQSTPLHLRCFMCPPGFHHKNGTCEACPPGFFTEYFGQATCTTCSAGFYSKVSPSSSFVNCEPCAAGSYNTEKPGEENICIPCKPEEYCPLASQHPLSNETRSEEIFKKIPEREQLDVSQRNALMTIYTGTIVFIVICILTLVIFTCIHFINYKLMRKFIKPVDMFTRQHRAEDLQPIIVKRTTFGGTLTIIFCIAATGLVFTLTIPYSMDNHREDRSLIPAQSSNEFVSGKIRIDLWLYGYRGVCKTRHVKVTLNGIQIVKDPVSTNTSYDHDHRICALTWICTSCSFRISTDKIGFTFTEEMALAQVIQWKVSTESGIPKLRGGKYIKESVDGVQLMENQANINAPYGTLFRGKIPTEIHLVAVPTVYNDQNEFSGIFRVTGYHCEFSKYIPGSTGKWEDKADWLVDQSTFHYDRSGIRIEFIFQLEENILKVDRIQRQTLQGFLSSVLGSIAGLYGAFGLILVCVEYITAKLRKFKWFEFWDRAKMDERTSRALDEYIVRELQRTESEIKTTNEDDCYIKLENQT